MTDEISLFTDRFNRLDRPYMVTGATAAIVYGQPRVTNDLDLVIAMDQPGIEELPHHFPEEDFYLPPAEVMLVEISRERRGHFNIIHHESGFKADVYLANEDPLHQWALPLRRSVPWADGLLWIAPPEYVILRKLEFYREGGSSKHLSDIRAMLATTDVNQDLVTQRSAERGLAAQWDLAQANKSN